MNKFDYYSALCGESKVEYDGNVYEVIGTTYNGVILQSVNDDTHVTITFRQLRQLRLFPNSGSTQKGVKR